VLANSDSVSLNSWFQSKSSHTRDEKLEPAISNAVNGAIDASWSAPEIRNSVRDLLMHFHDAVFVGKERGCKIAKEHFNERWGDEGDESALPARFCAPSRARNKQIVESALLLASVFGDLPHDAARLIEAGDIVDQLVLWLMNYEFLQSGEAALFIRSIFECAGRV